MYDVKLFENGGSLEQIIPCEALCIGRFNTLIFNLIIFLIN